MKAQNQDPPGQRREYDADVVIVGLGPVGAMTANLLGQAGVKTLVLERDVMPHTLPRAGATDDEVIRIFQSAGLADELLPLLDLGQSTMFLSAQGDPLVTMRPSGARNGYPQLAFFYQPDIERLLRAGLERYPHVSVQMGVRVEALTQDEGGVTVWTRSTGPGTQTPVRAKYVVGCDGGRSTVRGLCSIPFSGATYAQPWLVVDAKLEEPLKEVTCFQFIGDPNRPAVTVPLPGNHHRWEFMVLPGEDPADLATLETAKSLVSPWVDPERIHVLRHIVYTFHARAAQRWRSGRVLLAGDAAHLMPPFAGQGLASGFRDAHNLAWKLASVLAGTASPHLLDSYERERRPHVVRMTRLTRFSGALVQTRNRHVAKVRDALLSKAAQVPFFTEGRFKPDLYYPQGAFDRSRERRGSGHAFPQPRARAGDELGLLDEFMGPGWSIIGSHVDPQAHLTPENLELWKTLGASFVTVGTAGHRVSEAHEGTASVEDIDGYAIDFFDTHGGDFAIVRPDRIVFAMPEVGGLNRATELYCDVVSQRTSTGRPAGRVR